MVELVRGHVAEHGIGQTEVIFPAELVVPPRRTKPRLTQEPPGHLPVAGPASISSAAASRACSRRARSSAVNPPPSGYLMTMAYRTARQPSAELVTSTVKDTEIDSSIRRAANTASGGVRLEPKHCMLVKWAMTWLDLPAGRHVAAGCRNAEEA